MEYEKIKKLMEDMGNSKLSAIDIEFPDGIKISMKKEANSTNAYNNVELTSNTDVNNQQIENKIVDDNLKIILSPMVGTFYLKPSPTSNPYVEVGKKVKKGEVLCIIEAMKLMNEIESEFDGEIAEIYVKDGDVVEYGTKLFAIN